MKLGNFKIFFFCFSFILANTFFVFADDKIESVPLINLEELSPTFEEDKDTLEKIDEQNSNLIDMENTDEENIIKKNDKIYINIKALDKITAKTNAIFEIIKVKHKIKILKFPSFIFF